jgi:ATP-binding cassette subfamily B protein
MKLPISFFDKKMIGDISQRLDDYNRVQTFLTNTLLSITTAIIIFIVYGIVMANYNLLIVIVFAFFSLLYIIRTIKRTIKPVH